MTQVVTLGLSLHKKYNQKPNFILMSIYSLNV